MEEVGANNKDKKDKQETPVVDIDIHVGVFFDGTNNNANVNEWKDWFKIEYFRGRSRAYGNRIKLDPLKKNSNPAILSSLFATGGSETYGNVNEKYLHVYIEGSGANEFQADNEVLDIILHGKPVKGLGFGVGSTGVVAKVSKAIKYVSERIEAEELNAFTNIQHIHFYVFGFSRGSACARLFSYIIARNAGASVGRLDREFEFVQYLSIKYFKNYKVCFLDKYNSQNGKKMTVDFLGIYDTVSAIGFLKEENDKVNAMRLGFMGDPDFWGNFHRDNSKEYGLFSPSLTNIVLSTCHICALDEFRANFALTDIGTSMPNNSIELYLPGCHSDIGGGYTPSSNGETKTLKKKTSNIWMKVIDSITNEDSELQTRMISDYRWENLSGSLLKKMGWVDDFEKEIVSENKDEIVFKHEPKPNRVYSNIPLHFMHERARQKAPILKSLFADIPPDYGRPEDIDLNQMWEKCKDYLSFDGRINYNEFSPEEYKRIRQKYLHFTSTDSLHSAGDLGNVPGRREGTRFSDICRLLYRGGQNDDNRVYYLQDMDYGK